jgi:hypothetical protein
VLCIVKIPDINIWTFIPTLRLSSQDYNLGGAAVAATTTPICIKFYNSGGSIVATYCDTPPFTPSSAYYMTNDWVVMYEGYKIHVEAQGDDSFIVDKTFMQYCFPGDWDESTCASYSSVGNGPNNLEGWCLSTDHTAAEVAEQNGLALLGKCCDGVESVVTGLASGTPNFSLMQYYGC